MSLKHMLLTCSAPRTGGPHCRQNWNNQWCFLAVSYAEVQTTMLSKSSGTSNLKK